MCPERVIETNEPLRRGELRKTGTDTVAELKTRLRELIQESTGIPAALITDESSFTGDLAVDSLSLASLQVNIESTFGISMSIDEISGAGEFNRIAKAVLTKRQAMARRRA